VANVMRVCEALEADLVGMGCYGFAELCDVCSHVFGHPEIVTKAVDMVWRGIAHLKHGASPSNEWIVLLRRPAEYSHGVCSWPADASMFEGKSLHALDTLGQLSPHPNVQEVLQRMEASGVALSFRIVNIGASDGACHEGHLDHDPANCLLQTGAWGGLVIEGNSKHAQALRDAFGAREDIHVVQAVLGLSNATAIVREHSDEPDVDLLKVDLDYCDDLIVASALDVPLRPKVLHAEVQLIFPPDVIFRPRTREAKPNTAAIQLPTVSSLGAFIVASNYTLLYVDGHNAVFVRPDLAAIFPSTRNGPWAVWLDHHFCRADFPTVGGHWANFKFGDFDFGSFLNGNKTDTAVVEAFVRRATSGVPGGFDHDLAFVSL